MDTNNNYDENIKDEDDDDDHKPLWTGWQLK